MKSRTQRLVALATALTLLFVAAGAQAQDSEEDNTLYFLGVMLGQSLRNFALTPEEFKIVNEGLQAEMAGEAKPLDTQAYGQRLQALSKERAAKAATAEAKASEDFVAAAKKEKGAEVTDSGLVYRELKAGTGETPGKTDTVKVHYHGTLRDGKVFDSSVQRGTPAEFPLNRVIPCWTEGVQKIKVGGKAKLTCPSAIAYGDRGAPPNIPGGAVLTFEVELLEIVQ